MQDCLTVKIRISSLSVILISKYTFWTDSIIHPQTVSCFTGRWPSLTVIAVFLLCWQKRFAAAFAHRFHNPSEFPIAVTMNVTPSVLSIRQQLLTYRALRRIQQCRPFLPVHDIFPSISIGIRYFLIILSNRPLTRVILYTKFLYFMHYLWTLTVGSVII